MFRFRLRTLLIVLAVAAGVLASVAVLFVVAKPGFDAIRQDAIDNPPVKRR